MRAMLACLLFVLVGCTGPQGLPGPMGPPGPQGPSYSEPAYPRATVRQLTYQTVVVCAAVVISSKLALTAEHCVALADKESGAGKLPVYVDGVRTKAVLRDTVNDVAVLEAEHGDFAGPYAKVAAGVPAVDAPVVAIGYPLYGVSDVYQLQVATRGLYQGKLTTRSGRTYIAATPALAQGNSGGGLFTLAGDHWELIGICAGILTHFHDEGGVAAPSHLGIYAIPPALDN